jgi:uncharacterized protein (DUF433 family)
MTATGYAHIELAPDGTPYIAGTRIGVARIALDHILHGRSAEEIPDHYPGLTFGQVYSALAYYYDHKDEIDRQIEDEDEEFRRSRAEWAASNAEFLARLKARRKEA